MTDINKAKGKDMVGAALAIYGSRTSMLLYNTYTQNVEELTLLKLGKGPLKWIITTPKMVIEKKATNFSPEGVKTCYDN
jgi:fructose-1,6-bisphosphatase